ncbi:MAG: sulfate/thiosulfate ABC transporter permease CysW, partial [Methylotenera sp.]
MSNTSSQYTHYQNKISRSRATSEPTWVRWSLIAITLTF